MPKSATTTTDTTTPTTRLKTTTNGRRGILDREMPHSIDAERAVLGAMLLDNDAISEAVTTLADAGSSVFYSERHRKLYEFILGLWDANKPLDGVVIKDELVRQGAFESLGGFEFLAELIGHTPSSHRAREYAAIVKDKYLLRRLINATHKVLDRAFEPVETAQVVLDFAEQAIFEVTEQRVSGGATALPKLLPEVFQQIQDLDGRALTGEPSGILELDEETCGFQPAELIIIAGRPSMGKTALGLNIAEHMAIAESEPRPVLFFSLEMSRRQVAQRILCSQAGVDAHVLRRGKHSAIDMQELQRAAARADGKPLFVDDTASLTITELRARARVAHRKHGIRAVFVDYLQLMHAPGNESRQQEVASISRGLKALAKELNIPVIAMAQLNRGVEDRSNNRPRMSDLRESGAIEQDADVILLLHREAYYKVGQGAAAEASTAEEESKAELIIAKQRNGPVGTVDLRFDRRYTRFGNYTPGDRYRNAPEANFA
jgi:replicative DNA helicase